MHWVFVGLADDEYAPSDSETPVASASM